MKTLEELTLPTLLVVATLAVAILCSGCKSGADLISALPPGTQFQGQAVGVKFAPSDPFAPFVFGHSHVSYQTPPPADAGVGINRIGTVAGLTGVQNTGTQTVGPVGDQIQAAGGPAALDTLLQGRVPAVLPASVGATDPDPTTVSGSQ